MGMMPSNHSVGLVSSSSNIVRPENYDRDGAIFLPHGFNPSDKDVICGWARQHQSHPGNKRFRQLIKFSAPLYKAASSKVQKTQVIAAVVEKIRHDSSSVGGGGFIKQTADGHWYEIGDDKARDKVGHAIRRCLEIEDNPASRRSKEAIRSSVMYGSELLDDRFSPSPHALENFDKDLSSKEERGGGAGAGGRKENTGIAPRDKSQFEVHPTQVSTAMEQLQRLETQHRISVQQHDIKWTKEIDSAIFPHHPPGGLQQHHLHVSSPATGDFGPSMGQLLWKGDLSQSIGGSNSPSQVAGAAARVSDDGKSQMISNNFQLMATMASNRSASESHGIRGRSDFSVWGAASSRAGKGLPQNIQQGAAQLSGALRQPDDGQFRQLMMTNTVDVFGGNNGQQQRDDHDTRISTAIRELQQQMFSAMGHGNSGSFQLEPLGAAVAPAVRSITSGSMMEQNHLPMTCLPPRFGDSFVLPSSSTSMMEAPVSSIYFPLGNNVDASSNVTTRIMAQGHEEGRLEQLDDDDHVMDIIRLFIGGRGGSD